MPKLATSLITVQKAKTLGKKQGNRWLLKPNSVFSPEDFFNQFSYMPSEEEIIMVDLLLGSMRLDQVLYVSVIQDQKSKQINNL